MPKNPLSAAMAETAQAIGTVRLDTRARRSWAFVRLDVLEDWAYGRKEENVQARLEELTRTYFAAPADAAVRFGNDTMGHTLYAVWIDQKRSAEPDREPEFDGTPAYLKEQAAAPAPAALTTLLSERETARPGDTEDGEEEEEPMNFPAISLREPKPDDF
jgi:hypothetical protein